MSSSDLTAYDIIDQPKETAIRLIREHVLSYSKRLVIAALFMAIAAGIPGIQALMMETILDDIFISKNLSLLYPIAGVIIAIGVTSGFANMISNTMMEGIGHRIVGDLQERLFAHILKQDIDALSNTHTGRLQSLFLFDVGLIKEAVSRAVTGLAKDGLKAIFLIGVMFYQDWRLAIGGIIVIPLIIYPIQRLSKRIRKAATRMQDVTGRFATAINEMSTGVRHIKSYGMEDHEISNFHEVIKDRVALILKSVKARAMTAPLTETVGATAFAVVIVYGGNRVIEGASTPGQFFSFLTALLMAYQPLKSLAKFNSAIQEGLPAAGRAFALLDIEPRIKSIEGSAPLNLSGASIKFDQVDFEYNNDNPILQNLNVEIEAGKKTALVGFSGSGKSTVINMIARFYDPKSGNIYIDGQNIRDITLSSLRNASAIVTQEAVLFDDTISANIGYGKFGSSQEEIVKAAKASQAHDFISALPEGYDTVVGEGGVRLSGGQRQRLNIARAMLKDAPILLLDEATSALDSESESKVQESLDRLTENKTSVVVAHRLSTIHNADRIYVMDKGEVAEFGNHNELMAKNGIYASLYRLQERGFEG